MTPRPGDVIRFDGGEYDGRLAVIDGEHFGMIFDEVEGPVVLAVLGARAFYGDGGGLKGRTTTPEREYVSCSGGPCPFVPMDRLNHQGETTHRFWRWIDRRRANGGEEYERTVNLWTVAA